MWSSVTAEIEPRYQTHVSSFHILYVLNQHCSNNNKCLYKSMPYNHQKYTMILIIINIVIILDKNSYMHLQSSKIDHQHSVKNKQNEKKKNHQNLNIAKVMQIDTYIKWTLCSGSYTRYPFC